MEKLLRQAPGFCVAMALLLGLAVAAMLLPDTSFSDLENRALQQFVLPDVQSISSGTWMDQMETYVADQLPGRDVWMAVKALWDAEMLRNERNGILIGRNGWLFERTDHLALRTARQNVSAVNAIAEHTDVPVTLALVPTSGALYDMYLPGSYRADDQRGILAELYAGAEGLKTIDMLPVLEAEAAARPELPLFFRTDHHWTDAGAWAGYRALCVAWGVEVGDWETQALDGMMTYGSYYARAPSPLIRADSFSMEQPEGIVLSIEGERMHGLYDAASMELARDKYAKLLYGNHGHCTLTSEARGGTLIVFKDSYANLLLPKLAQHYGRIEAIDLRYYRGDLEHYLAETEADGILCLYGLTTWLTDRNLVLFTAGWSGG